jgi:peroxiredoxin
VAELVRLRDRQDDFQTAGVEVAAVSADDLEKSRSAVAKYELPFDVFSDEQGLLMDALGLRHTGRSPDGSDIYYATLYLVDHRSEVVWRFASRRTNERCPPDRILEAAGAHRNR